MTPRYSYGEAFKRVRVLGMGRRGPPWCNEDPNGVLVLMAHQSYFHKGLSGYYYELPLHESMPIRTGSAAQSLRILEKYFAAGKPIHLLVAVFKDDGGPQPNGRFEAAEFLHATGDAYRAEMRQFDHKTAHLVCDKLVHYQY